MNTALWIITAILAGAFLVGGAVQLFVPKEKIRSASAAQHWVDDFGDGHVKAIGTIKITGALGLILPAITGIAVVLVPLAASGLMLVMAGAGTTRFRRNEWGYLVGDLLFLGLLAFVAWGRFSLEPLT